MKAVEKVRDYVDGEIVLTTHPVLPIPDEALDDRTPPFDVGKTTPLAYAA